MCGIAGVVRRYGHLSDSEPALSASLAAMRHRGPDADGRCAWASAAGISLTMGMTRLSVLDLSAAGLQPMTTPDGRFTLAYNGEITNFIEVRQLLEAEGAGFSSSGDTEVLLRAWEAWGPDACHRLEGMYAFAILDRQESTLTLCRDPFGIKPLFVANLDDDGFAFASEIGGMLPLLGRRPRLDWEIGRAHV